MFDLSVQWQELMQKNHSILDAIDQTFNMSCSQIGLVVKVVMHVKGHFKPVNPAQTEEMDYAFIRLHFDFIDLVSQLINRQFNPEEEFHVEAMEALGQLVGYSYERMNELGFAQA